MVFNRHLKALNLCNHTDTFACVLYELLVNLELINVGFQTHDQGSTSFSIVQFSRSCLLSSRTAQSLYQRSYFLSSTFFDIFSSFPNAFLKAFHPHAVRFPAAFLLVHLFIWLLKSCCLARQLIYNTTLSNIVNTFFRFFL